MTFTSTTIRKLRELGLPQEQFDAVLAIFEEATLSKPKKKGGAEDRKERGTRLPENWTLPIEYREWALAVGLRSGEVEREAMKFRNYWHNRTDTRAIKLKWFGTWQNWCVSMLEKAGREPIRPNGAASAPANGPEAFDSATWAAISKRYKSSGQWAPEWGPGPDRIDCRMPAEFL